MFLTENHARSAMPDGKAVERDWGRSEMPSGLPQRLTCQKT